MNKVFLMGRLTKDPDVNETTNGQAIAKFTLAVERGRTKDGEDKADFIRCVAFGRTAEFAHKYAKKGVKFMVEGRLETGSYTKNDGTKVYTTDVIVNDMEFAESRAAAEGYAASGSSGSGEPESYTKAIEEDEWMAVAEGIDDELPFR